MSLSHPVYKLASGGIRALGRDTEATVKSWSKIISAVPVAPKMFAGVAPKKSPNIRRFHHKSFLSQRSRGYCFPAGTPILLPDGSEKPIEEIQVGDEVITHRGRVKKVVDKFARMYNGEMVSAIIEGWPRHLNVTSGHKLFVYRNPELGKSPAGEMIEVEAKDLIKGDCLVIPVELKDTFLTNTGYLSKDGYLGRVSFVWTYHRDGMVYNFEVEEDHSYVANGVKVCNCTGFNWCGTLMTRLRIPADATATTGDPLQLIQLSPLYTYDIGRWQCQEDGYNVGMGDGLIGSQVSLGSQKKGCVELGAYPSSPNDIDNHRNGTRPSNEVLAFGAKHLVKEFALADSFENGLGLLASGFPLAFASDIPSGMLQTDEKGFFRMKGSVVGGHEYQVVDYDKDQNLIWVAQAWENWGEKNNDPEYKIMHGFTQIGCCPLDEMEKWFSDAAMSSGSSEIMAANTIEGFAPPIVDYSSM